MKNVILLFFALFVFAAGFFPLFSQEIDPEESPEDNAVITARGGLGYYYWKSVYLTDMSVSPSFDHDIQPYLMKRFEVKASIYFLSAGADYLTNELNDLMNFENEEQVREVDDPIARQLALFAGISLGDYTIKSDVVFRKFQGEIKSNGQKLMNGSSVPLYYYNESGTIDSLNPGDKASWFTTYRQYDLKLVKGKSFAESSWDVGLQYIIYESPAEMEIQLGHNSLSNTQLPVVPQALMFTTSKIYNFVFGYHNRSFITDSFIFEWYVPVTFGFTSMENDYMKLNPQPGFPPTNFVSSTYVQASLQYVTAHAKLELGADFNMLIANIYNKSTLNKNLDYLNSGNGTPQSLPAGTDITVRSMKWEYFCGLYFRASVYF